ncbi:MAG: M23 family metallopeptidase [Saprospiraceae bacterium]|nr:M23 family metallopeptidase [Saprospiraceae bacterium]
MKNFLLKLAIAMSCIFAHIHSTMAQETFGYPVNGTNVSANCYFGNQCAGAAGYQHTGVDFPLANGTAIKATASGKVYYIMPLSGTDHNMGNTVILQHRLNSGIVRYSMYAHLNSINGDIAVGKVVNKGQQLG